MLAQCVQPGHRLGGLAQLEQGLDTGGQGVGRVRAPHRDRLFQQGQRSTVVSGELPVLGLFDQLASAGIRPEPGGQHVRVLSHRPNLQPRHDPAGEEQGNTVAVDPGPGSGVIGSFTRDGAVTARTWGPSAGRDPHRLGPSPHS